MNNLSETSITSEYFTKEVGEQQYKDFLLALRHAIKNDEIETP